MPQRRATDLPPPPTAPALQRWFEGRTLVGQHALLAGGATLLLLALLAVWQHTVAAGPVPPWLPLAALLAGGLGAGAASLLLARHHARSLAELAETARQLRREDAADDLNLPLLGGVDELRQATVSLRRMVDFHRGQRQALQARNAALGERAGRQPLVRVRGAGHVAHDGREIKRQHALVLGACQRVTPQAERLRVGLDQRHLLRLAAGEFQVIDGLAVDEEHGGRGAVFRGHIGNGGAVAQREGGGAFAVKL
mgnify:CR=1 FL=1